MSVFIESESPDFIINSIKKLAEALEMAQGAMVKQNEMISSLNQLLKMHKERIEKLEKRVLILENRSSLDIF